MLTGLIRIVFFMNKLLFKVLTTGNNMHAKIGLGRGRRQDTEEIGRELRGLADRGHFLDYIHLLMKNSSV